MMMMMMIIIITIITATTIIIIIITIIITTIITITIIILITMIIILLLHFRLITCSLPGQLLVKTSNNKFLKVPMISSSEFPKGQKGALNHCKSDGYVKI